MGLLRAVVNNRFLESLFLYNALLLAVFTLIYSVIDFDRHFILPDHIKHADTSVKMYYAFLSQSNVMAGEIAPRTSTGRTLLAVHILLSWSIILAFVVPWPVPPTV